MSSAFLDLLLSVLLIAGVYSLSLRSSPFQRKQQMSHWRKIMALEQLIKGTKAAFVVPMAIVNEIAEAA